MDKSEREKEELYAWGKQHGLDYYFPTFDKEKASYFIRRKVDANSYIREYGFETLPEIMDELDNLWEKDEVSEQIKKVVGIAALKNKPSEIISEQAKGGSSKETEEKREGGDRLPTYIYNF
ncbi:hypothetical protein [Bacteroides congonensis]|uniref:hypothetical protein n=1 Tax=Bacteroides congonensis TaxID=1871006 RepID=UPI003218FB08